MEQQLVRGMAEKEPMFVDGKLWQGHRLRLAHAYGIYPAPIHDAVIAHGDDGFIFCVGRHVAICDHVHHKLNFLQRDPKYRVITAASKSPNGKFLAIAERQGTPEDGISQISVLGLPAPGAADFDKKPQDALRVLHPGNRKIDIVDLAFTGDSKFLVSLSGEPDSTITYWKWEIDKVVATHDIKIPVWRLQLNPKNACMLSISGPKYLRIWEYNTINHTMMESPSMFPLKQEKQMNIVDHCWVLGAFLCSATEDGHVHIFEMGETGPEHREHVDVRAVIARDEASGAKAQEREQAKVLAKMGMLSRGYKEPPPVLLNALCAWSRGFVVGGDQGYLGVFKVDMRAQAESFGTFRIPEENATIWQMCSGSEDTYLTILSYVEKEIDDELSPEMPSIGAVQNSTSTTARRASTTRGSVDSGSIQAMADAFKPRTERVWSLSTFPVGQADLAATGQLEVFAPVYPLGTHHGAITSMSRPNCRRIVATCGTDMNLKVWGYPNMSKIDQEWTSELTFPVSTYEKPKACAVHPLGFQVAIVIEDLLRVYHLTTQSMIQTLFDLPLKHPGDVCYSNSGHMLAVTSEKDVIVIDPWRRSLIHMFSGHGGHLSNVNQVLFSDDDQVLLSCGAAPHGAIYGWALETDTKDRVFEHIYKGTSYTCMCHDLSRNLVAACTSEGNLRIIEHLSSTDNVEIVADRGSAYTTLTLSVPLGALFAGTEQGSVRIFRWPMADGGALTNPFIEISLHAHSISQLSVSYDLRLLISACRGGAVMACEIDTVRQGDDVRTEEEQMHAKHIIYRHRQGGPANKKPNKEDDRKIAELQKKLSSGQVVSANTSTLDEMLMVPKQYLNERLSEIKDLEERMRNLQNENEYALEQKDQETQEKLNHIGQARKNERKAAEEKYDALFVQHTKALERHEDAMTSASSLFNNRTREMQEGFDERISKEVAKEHGLLNDLETLKKKHKTSVAEMERKHDEQLTELRKTQENALKKWRDEHEKVVNLLKSDGLKFEEALAQQEKEYESEISEMLEHKRVALQVESEKSTTALKDGVSMKQTISMLQKQRKEKDEELWKSQQDNKKLNEKLNQTKAMFEDVKEQLKERERGLKVKDQNLERLREQMKHLESFRFVLFHKVRALEDERDPLEEQVNMLKNNVGDMYTEFVREFRQKQQIDQQLTDKSELSKALQNENVKMRAQLAQLKKDGRRLIQEVESVLHAEDSESFEKMPTMLRQVLDKHQGLIQWQAPKDDTPDNYVDPFADATKESSIIEEMVIQRDLLFRKNQIAVGSASQSKRECAQDVRRLTTENAALISEMNTLRNERKAWQRSCKEMEAQLMALNSQAASGRGGLTGSASAPGLNQSAPTQRRGPKHPGGVADTPYVKRKVVEQQDVFRRNQQKGRNQLPPVTQPPGGAAMSMASSTHPKPTAQEKRFTQSLESVQAGRQQMERQGFDMGSLTSAAKATFGADLLLDHPPAAGAAEADGELASFAAAEEIQSK